MKIFDRWAQAAMVYYANRRLEKTNKEIATQKAVLASRMRRYGPRMQKSTLDLMRQIEAEANGARHSCARIFHHERAYTLKTELIKARVAWRETAQTLAKPYGRAVRRRVQLTALLKAAQKLGS